jgi:hypothetical protein
MPGKSDPPTLSPEHLHRIADILGVTASAAVTKLAERVVAAMREYRDNATMAQPSPSELRMTFGELSERYHRFHESLMRLGPAECRHLDATGLELDQVHWKQNDPFGYDEALASLRKVGILLRAAQRRLPRVRHGPQPDRARRRLVIRLGHVYAKTKTRTREDGAEVFELPTRRHDAYQGRDVGTFRDFVIAVHEALGFSNPKQGVDDLIRSVWGGMGKKRRQ